MLIHSHLPYNQSISHARVPAGGINLIASIDSISEAQVTASFFGSTKSLHGENAIPSAETSTHNHSNQQYSITAVTTSAGAIAERYAYSAYGEPTILDASGSVLASSAINSRYSYTGREWDATVGLYHFRARWMSPRTGRFLGRDPIGYNGGINLYGHYFGLAFADPTGLRSWFGLAGNVGSTSMFGWHYFFGGGQSINISGTHVLWQWRVAAGDKLKELKDSIGVSSPGPSCDNPYQQFSGSTTASSISLNLGEEAQYNIDGWDEPWKILNESTVTIKWHCALNTECETCCDKTRVPKRSEWKCKYEFVFHDRFANPLDIGIDKHGTDYEFSQADWNKCYQSCIASDEARRMIPGFAHGMCSRKCDKEWPATELIGSKAYDIHGWWSESERKEFTHEGCKK